LLKTNRARIVLCPSNVDGTKDEGQTTNASATNLRRSSFVVRLIERNNPDELLGLTIILALLLAGLSLIHFIVLVFGLCFMGVSGLVWALSAHRALLWSRLAQAAGSAGLALALAGPWLWLL